MEKEHEEFLDKLIESCEINMFGAGYYLQEEFGLDRKEAREVLKEWMDTYETEEVRE